jgi:DNA-binding response OmpR family regulator
VPARPCWSRRDVDASFFVTWAARRIKTGLNSRLMKILICDDDAVLLRMMELNIKEQNLGDVVVAKNGREALQLLNNQSFDLVVTDIHMPYNNGEDILNLIRLEQRKSTPIIMMSSDGDEDVIAHAKKKGVNEFVKKPIKSVEVSALMDAITRQIKSITVGGKAS